MDVFALQEFGLSIYALIVTVITFLIALIVLVNGLKQALFKKRNEPPVVFHWLPFIGSALAYGEEPIKFLSDCQAKVKTPSRLLEVQ